MGTLLCHLSPAGYLRLIYTIVKVAVNTSRASLLHQLLLLRKSAHMIPRGSCERGGKASNSRRLSRSKPKTNSDASATIQVDFPQTPVADGERSYGPVYCNLSSTRSVIDGVSEEDTSRVVNEPDDDFDADTLNEIVMAVEVRERGNVGCAYYVAREEKLFFMEDSKYGGIEIVENC
jgi:hypothetical protein